MAWRWAAGGGSSTVYTTDAWDLAHLWEGGHQRVAAESETHQGVKIRRFAVHHPTASRVRFAGVRWLAGHLPDLASPLASRLSQAAPQVPGLRAALGHPAERPGLVHGWNLTLDGLLWPALQCARRNGVPFVLTPFLHLGGRRSEQHRYTAPHQVRLLQAADRVIAMTQTEASVLSALGISPDRITVAPPGITPANLDGGNGPAFRARHGIEGPLVAYLGALARAKGAYDALAAIGQLVEQGRKVSLALAGPPADDTFAGMLAAQAPAVRAACRLLGYVSDQERLDLLSAADVLILPSATESFGIVYLEAWYYGKPVIGAHSGSVGEVIADGVDGWLVPFGDAASLARRIDGFLEDPETGRRMGDLGRAKTLAHYTWGHTYCTLERVYRDLLS